MGSEEKKPKKRGWDEIESLFDDKKKKRKEITEKKEQKKQRKDQKQTSKKPPPAGWVDDGLGGIYNEEGYTGRVEDGIKIFKAHVLNKSNAGQTKDCPFDCQCCFI